MNFHFFVRFGYDCDGANLTTMYLVPDFEVWDITSDLNVITESKELFSNPYWKPSENIKISYKRIIDYLDHNCNNYFIEERDSEMKLPITITGYHEIFEKYLNE